MDTMIYPLGHKQKMSPSLVLQKALALGVVLSVNGNKLHAAGNGDRIAELAPDLRQHRAELLQLLALPKPLASALSSTSPAYDSSQSQLLGLAMRFCDAIQASDTARQDWRTDIEAMPATDQPGLADYLRDQLAQLAAVPAHAKQSEHLHALSEPITSNRVAS